jgi:NADH-quinone oxidoreductase subunit F
MSELDLTPLQTTLGEMTPNGRTALLPALHAAQSLYGYLPEGVIAEIGRQLRVPLAEIYGVIEFYTMFYTEPVGKRVIRICEDPACAMAGSDALIDSLSSTLGIQPGETTPDGSYTLEPSPCLGLCEHAPAVTNGDIPISRSAGRGPSAILDGNAPIAKGIVAGDFRLLTANCGRERTTSLQEYREMDGYAGLTRALTLSPDEVVKEVKDSGLVGRGGAAFPTGVKWEGAARAEGEPKYVICNADESEPGTFKDRVLLEEDPHRTLEGMIIAAYAISAHKGYIYVRGEYPRAYAILENALQEARQAGLLGENILGSGFDFDIEMRLGAGAYICGEETALFESIEGKRGFPRIKPPYPTTHGLFGKPTVINNVETLCNVPFILQAGPSEYRKIGTEKSPGPKLFCLSGDVVYPGLYEVPFGVTLRHLVYDLAGGIRQGADLQAVLIGGAAGAFAKPDSLDVPLTFEDMRAAGLPLGSGVIMVFNQDRDLRDALKRLARFFAHESCGKCYPCQLGTQRQHEILIRVADGNVQPGDTARLSDVGWTMTESSLCGLGQTAATAVLSAISLWPELFSTKTGS